MCSQLKLEPYFLRFGWWKLESHARAVRMQLRLGLSMATSTPSPMGKVTSFSTGAHFSQTPTGATSTESRHRTKRQGEMSISCRYRKRPLSLTNECESTLSSHVNLTQAYHKEEDGHGRRTAAGEEGRGANKHCVRARVTVPEERDRTRGWMEIAARWLSIICTPQYYCFAMYPRIPGPKVPVGLYK